MGTSQSAPEWLNDIYIMEHFGWTEEELNEGNSALMLSRVKTYFVVQNQVDKQKAAYDKIKGKGHGTRGGHY